ncbi:S-layer homology domain-containing protein [Paenibacillus sp. GCM10027626]|uniref:S-layer homology domain-containing protein n=1 Tax=Paenibacillus sp. GCM10027626 TaxID=3273411 RepID=UPI003635B88C
MKLRRWITILAMFILFAGVLPQYASAGVLTEWEDRIVLIPDGSSFNGIAYGNGLFVTVGTDGIIMTSTDGKGWESQTSGTDKDLVAITYGGPSNQGEFVAVGREGMIVTSIDGEHWNVQASNTDEDLSGIAYGGGAFAAVGDNGAIVVSRNGEIEKWEPQSMNNIDFKGIAYGATGTYVAVGSYNYSPFLFTSNNLEKWNMIELDAGDQLNGIAYGNGRYVAVGILPDYIGGIIVSSNDGVTWEEYNITEKPIAIAYGNGTFVAIDYRTIISSNDGKNWHKQSSGAAEGFRGITYGNGSYTVVGDSGTILQSYSKCAVTYNGNGSTGGSVPTDNGIYNQGSAVMVLGNTDNLVKTGYTFAGWNTQADGKGTDYAPGVVFSMGKEDVVLYAKWKSGNANLSSLTLSGVTLNPAFAPETTAYTANVANSVGSTTVTLAAADAANAAVTASVYNNGAVTSGPHSLTDGAASPSLPLSVGGNTIQLIVTAQDGTTKTYAVTVTRDSGSDTPTPSNPDSSGNTPSGNTSSSGSSDSATNKADFRVLINGKEQERAAAAAITRENGRDVFTVTVDAAKMAAQLAKEADKPVVSVIVTRSADKVTAALSGDIVKTLEEKHAVLEIRTPGGGFKLPAAKIGIDRLSGQLAGNTKLKDVVVQLTVATSDAAKTALLDTAAKLGRFGVVAAPVEMAILASYEGKTVKADKFSSYAEWEIPLPGGIDGSKITTAVKLNENGAVHHVPTRLTSRDGKHYAVVNSLTNGTFALIWRPVAFADVEGHWAKAAVNDMASRTVVNGVDSERYNPDAAITRAEFAAIIVRALGLDDHGEEANTAFTDVLSADWYAGAVAQAKEFGIVNGFVDGTFRPTRTITREEAVVMIARAMKVAGLETGLGSEGADDILSGFRDGAAIGAWAKVPVAAAVESGLVQGSAAGLLPKNEITRAETAAIVQRLLVKAKLIDNKLIN